MVRLNQCRWVNHNLKEDVSIMLSSNTPNVVGINERPRTECRSDRGLTTLEWLLIVAAVAGLAALAVVLVQNVVDETAEEITGSNARVTAAEVAAARITTDARADLPAAVNTSDTDSVAAGKAKQDNVNDEYRSKCNRLSITYSDASIDSEWWAADVASSRATGTLLTESSRPTGDIDTDVTPAKKALCEVEVTDS